MMKPIDFDESTAMLIGSGDIKPLPVFKNGEQIISYWQMSWKERFQSLWYGKIWLSVKAETTQPPVFLSAEKTMFTGATK